MRTSDELRAMIECEANNPQVRLGVELVLPTVEALEAQNRELIETLEKIVKDGDAIRYEIGAVARLGLQVAVSVARKAIKKAGHDV